MPQRTWQDQIPYLRAFADQPRSLAGVADLVADRLGSGDFDVWRPPASVLLAGIGASHAALAAPVFALRSKGVPAHRTNCGEMPPGSVRQADLYVGVSQSGHSRETVQTLRDVDRDARTCVVNHASSPLGDLCHAVLSFGGVPDSRVSSIGFTATVMALGMTVEHWTTGGLDPTWRHIGHRMEAVIEDAETVINAFAEQILGVRSVDVIGGGPSVTAAEEGALLLREGIRYPATGQETRSYLHGPMDSAGDTAHIVLGRERERLLVDQLAERTPHLLLVTDQDISPRAGRVLRIPAVPPCQRAILETAILQTLLRALAGLLDHDIDTPAFQRLDTKISEA